MERGGEWGEGYGRRGKVRGGGGGGEGIRAGWWVRGGGEGWGGRGRLRGLSASPSCHAGKLFKGK